MLQLLLMLLLLLWRYQWCRGRMISIGIARRSIVERAHRRRRHLQLLLMMMAVYLGHFAVAKAGRFRFLLIEVIQK
uniref:Putative secreted peptide n=1 Tax=Anopheles braziliensis TaxID=58242 RepID=A0A2M3ZS61_9DIPT